MLRVRGREREKCRERAEAGGVPAASGHMTRKMWDLIIPVLDCSQLLKLCPTQCKPAACPTATPGPCTDGPPRIMAGKTRRGYADTRNRCTTTGTRPLRNQDRWGAGGRGWAAHTAVNALKPRPNSLTAARLRGCNTHRRLDTDKDEAERCDVGWFVIEDAFNAAVWT